jgi:hypothetical protein
VKRKKESHVKSANVKMLSMRRKLASWLQSRRRNVSVNRRSKRNSCARRKTSREMRNEIGMSPTRTSQVSGKRKVVGVSVKRPRKTAGDQHQQGMRKMVLG